MRQASSNELYEKNNENDTIWWVISVGERGTWEFTFDQQTIFNMFEDYPEKLTQEQKQIFDKENPYWARFFSGKE